MPLEVIGAGFGRTGTASLKQALEELGYVKCHHMSEVFGDSRQADWWDRASRGEAVNWHEVFDGFKACVDWPSATYYKELAACFPDAKVILSTRDPESWYRSARESVYPISVAFPPWITALSKPMRKLKRATIRAVWDGTFESRFEDKAYALRVFHRHIDEVKEAIPADRLLIHRATDGWEPLCQFLGKSIPDSPYPRVNESARARRILRVLRVLNWLPLFLAIILIGILIVWQA